MLGYPSDGSDLTFFVSVALESYYNNDTNYIKFNPNSGLIQIYQNGEIVPQNLRVVTYVNGKPSQENIDVYYTTISGLNRSTLWQVPNYTLSSLDFRDQSDYLTLNNQTSSDLQDTTMLLLQFRIKSGTQASLLI